MRPTWLEVRALWTAGRTWASTPREVGALEGCGQRWAWLSPTSQQAVPCPSPCLGILDQRPHRRPPAFPDDSPPPRPHRLPVLV